MTLFSLGLIKIQTCFYGGVAVIRDDNDLYKDMYRIQEQYPVFTQKMWVKRIFTSFLLMRFINTKSGNAALLYAAKLKGQEREEFYVSLSRGFKPGQDFLSRFRFNPCASLLSFIYHRMTIFDYH